MAWKSMLSTTREDARVEVNLVDDSSKDEEV